MAKQQNADHQRFQEAVRVARANREFIQTVLKDSRMVKILGLFEKEIESHKEALITTEKKDIERMQAGILARRGLLATLKAAYENELEEATRNLAEYEKHNALFIEKEEKASLANAV